MTGRGTLLLGLAVVCAWGAAGAWARPQVAKEDPPGDKTFTYRCAQGKTIKATYPGNTWARWGRIVWQGKTINMKLGLSASGSRYVHSGRHLEWWIKGSEGNLRDTKTDQLLARDCKTRDS